MVYDKMCGIVGYIGSRKAAPLLLKGLEKLEYRGYDSSGIALMEKGKIVTNKSKGRLDVLKEKLKTQTESDAYVGIGHTRWATHGAPSDHNSHPHTGKNSLFTIVHNGIIENYIPLKELLLACGYRFQSETDSEVIAHLLEENYHGNVKETILKTVSMLKGSYALGILCREEPDTLYAIRCESPLIVGPSPNGNFIASDIPAILEETKTVFFLENNELAILKKDTVTITNSLGEAIQKDTFTVDWSLESAEKTGYEHYMLKEIHEQPEAIRRTVGPRIKKETVFLGDAHFSKEELMKFQKIYIAACGSAYHVGMLGKYILEEFCRIPVEVDIASEFRYRNPLLNQNTLLIVISQSGETADTLAALREAKRFGASTLSIVNVVGSSIARESDKVLYTWAGPEISVATTKAYSAQLSIIYLLALDMASTLQTLPQEKILKEIKALQALPEMLEDVLKDIHLFEQYAEELHEKEHIFFIGRGTDFPLCLEGSLKLKEISYLHSEAYAAGELKHGPISLIEEGTPVIALATRKNLMEKTLSNIKEVKARGARVLLVTTKENEALSTSADEVYTLPEASPTILPSCAIIVLQMIAYFVAKKRDCDIDKPRNLAKSVTVE